MTALGLSYIAQARMVTYIGPQAPNYLSTGNDLILGPPKIIRDKVYCHIPAFINTLVIIYHPDHPTLFCGPALTTMDQHNFCTLVITNSGPYKVSLSRNHPHWKNEFLFNQDQLIPLHESNVVHMIQVIAAKTTRSTISNQEIEAGAHFHDVLDSY